MVPKDRKVAKAKVTVPKTHSKAGKTSGAGGGVVQTQGESIRPDSDRRYSDLLDLVSTDDRGGQVKSSTHNLKTKRKRDGPPSGDVGAARTAVPRAARRVNSSDADESGSERQPQKKAKVSVLPQSQKRPHRAAVINFDHSDSDLPLSLPPPLPRRLPAATPRTSQPASQPARSQSRPRAAIPQGYEDDLDDDGEGMGLDHVDHGEEAEDDVDEEAELREQCVDFEAERVSIKGSGGSQSMNMDRDPSSSDDMPSAQPPRFRSKVSRSSSVVSYASEPPYSSEPSSMSYGLEPPEDRDTDDGEFEAPRTRSDNEEQDDRVVYDSDPMLDDDELDEEEAPAVVSRGQRQLTKKQQDKLRSEMPEIRPAQVTPKTKKHAQTSHHAGSVSVDSKHNSIKWRARTMITIIENPKSVKMAKRAQNGNVQQVMSHAYILGDQMMVFGRKDDRGLDITINTVNTMLTPLDKAGVDRIAYEALVQAADVLGYTGEGDIADRLERGVWEHYAKPLAGYVAHRLGMARTGIRKAIALVVEHQFRLTIPAEDLLMVPDKTLLLKEMNYVFPWTSMGGFDQRAPYESSVIKSAVRSGFFTNAGYVGIGLQNIALCTSSLESKPSEHEVPPEMVALATTAVESVIHEHSLRLSKAVEFGAASAPAYREHMVRLADFRQQRPKRYHRVMHDIFKAVTVGHTLHQGLDGGGAIINWNDIPDDEE
ncbi:uncharacterized protein C8Q71DRAFT_721998 [Rhodofomes roseus]|uniref:DUF6532 domain-containing protein n=1 Tax=Rhodofomes roseus TaxID=34475 RepID=A0ABQ8KPE0_9APHY|nr:uncharacterized protein C8Q71DRAFT_721998 [Rhodofomes roseus]KAH9840304.1 hypothetical protein C8Q71DRAFT_721998 [Rhodofomes roseus]